MNIINTYSNKRFTLNGVQYLKNYISKVSGNRIAVYNCYDNKDTLVEADLYSNFVIDGVTYGSAAATQAALIDVIYSRGTLGTDVGELIQDNIRIVKIVSILSTDSEANILAKINALPLYNVDQYTTVYFNCTDGSDRQIIYSMVGLGKGSYGTSGTQLTAENLIKIYEYVPGTVQNNETKYISFVKINQTDFNPLPTSEVANLFNTSIAPIIISEMQIPWVQVTVSGASQPSVKHIYQFLPGKGNYGSGGATVTASMFRYVNTLGATQQDIENTGNTETINLGEVTNYITALNSVGRDFTDENLQYFVKYTISGTSYFKIFIGTTYGLYGGTNTLQFTDEMWQDVVTSATPTPAVTLQDVLSNGSTAIINRETLIEYQDGTHIANVYVGAGTVDFNANDAQFHMNGTGADINVPLSLLETPTAPEHAVRLQDLNNATKIQPLPSTFFIGNTTYTGATIANLTYAECPSCSLNTFNFRSYMPSSYPTSYTNWVYVNGNDIYVHGTTTCCTGNADLFVLVLKDCMLKNGVLTPRSYSYKEYSVQKDATGQPYQWHGARFYKGYLYTCSRLDSPGISAGHPTQVFKINVNDLNEFKSINITTAGSAADLHVDNNGVYVLLSQTSATGYIVKLDHNINSYSTISTVGSVSSKRVRTSSSFYVYNGEIFVPTINNVSAPDAYNTIGISVYSTNGALLREVTLLPVSSGQTGAISPHWISIYQGKILISTVTANTNNKMLIRVDAKTLSLEESIQFSVISGSSSTKITNDNSIYPDGYMYLNEEYNDSGKLFKVKYNNFNDYSILQNNWYCLGTPDYYYYNENSGVGSGTVTSVTGVAGETTVANSTTTPVIGIASTYTAARDAYADSAAASAASGKQNTLVSGTNIKTVGGVTLLGSGDVSQVQNSLAASTTLAPSVTAVNNALLYFPRIIFASTTSYPGTGATSAILLKAVPISANDLSNGTLQTDLRARFTGNAGTKQMLLYMNTSASLTGATLLASGLIYNSSITSGNLHRQFSLNGTTLRGYAPIVQNIYPTTPTQPDLNVTYNPANQYYIIAACINGSSADTTTLDMFNITFTKATE